MASGNVAELIADTLAQAGIRRIFGVVGDSLNGLTDALRKRKAIDWIHVRHEEVAAFATNDKIAVDNVEQFVASAGALIRKKISFITQSGILAAHTSQQIARSALQFNLRIDVDDKDRIVLPADKVELRKLLKFLDEDYYESPLSKTRFVSSSKRAAD